MQIKSTFTVLAFAGMMSSAAFAQTEAAPAIQVTTGRQQPIEAVAPQTPAVPNWMQDAQNMQQTTVEWFENEHDFGQIIEGATVSYTFRFKNTGTAPLKLLRVKASCGCTTPSYTEQEVAPGEEGFVQVAFDSSGKLGFQNKAVTVTGNFEGTNMILRFKGEVVAGSSETPGQ